MGNKLKQYNGEKVEKICVSKAKKIINSKWKGLTYRSPQDPDAILSPILSSLLSISQPPDLSSCIMAFSTIGWEFEERDQDPCSKDEHDYYLPSLNYKLYKKMFLIRNISEIHDFFRKGEFNRSNKLIHQSNPFVRHYSNKLLLLLLLKVGQRHVI